MKSHMICALLIATLVFWPAAFGEILPWGDGKTSGSVAADASGSNTSESDDDSGDSGEYTTEAGTFGYYYEAYATAWAKVVEDNGWGDAAGVAQANTDAVSAYATQSFSSTGEGSATDDPDPVSGSTYFDAYTGVSADFTVVAVASIQEGSASSAGATAYAYAYANMY